MSQRSVEIFLKGTESEEKFDYFICGVAGALFAYLGQTYEPHRLAFDATVLTPLALLFLAISFFVGLKRIEASQATRNLNSRFLDAGEKAGSLTEAIHAGPGPYCNTEGGGVIDRATAIKLREKHLIERKVFRELCEEWSNKSGVRARCRNYMLIAGFGTVFLDRMFQPYL